MVANTPSLSYVKVRGREDIIDTFLDTVTFVTDCSNINGPGSYIDGRTRTSFAVILSRVIRSSDGFTSITSRLIY